MLVDRSCLSALVFALAAGAVLAGCGRLDQDRSQAAKVLRALEVVRAAPNAAKRRPADELAHEPCSSPVVCGARDSCAEAYQHLALGTEAAQRVKDELDRLETQPPVPPEKMAELSGALDLADREISGAKDSMRRCEEAASLLRRTFGI
jgi:hypothetical protein